MYGSQMFCSNMHNLTHLVDDVERFGPLDTFDAYPFESRLFGLKRLIRSGNLPLAQVSRRICEIQSNMGSQKYENPELRVPSLKNKILTNSSKVNQSDQSDKYSFIDFGNFCIDTNSEANRWILTDECDIVSVKYIAHYPSSNTIELQGKKMVNIFDFFVKPVASSMLYIFASNLELGETRSIPSEKVLCKMVRIDCEDIKLPKCFLSSHPFNTLKYKLMLVIII